MGIAANPKNVLRRKRTLDGQRPKGDTTVSIGLFCPSPRVALALTRARQRMTVRGGIRASDTGAAAAAAAAAEAAGKQDVGTTLVVMDERLRSKASRDLTVSQAVSEAVDAASMVQGAPVSPDEGFRIAVAALGLWSNYQISHPRAPHPRVDADHIADAASVLAVLRRVLPDGYCRRQLLTRSKVAKNLGYLELAAAFEEQDASECFPEEVTFFNGDEYSGSWRFGRRHGKGVYKFATGSQYAGEWKDGKMVGWGQYILPDGTKRNIRHS